MGNQHDGYENMELSEMDLRDLENIRECNKGEMISYIAIRNYILERPEITMRQLIKLLNDLIEEKIDEFIQFCEEIKNIKDENERHEARRTRCLSRNYGSYNKNYEHNA